MPHTVSLVGLHAEAWYCPTLHPLHGEHTVSSSMPRPHPPLLYHPSLHVLHGAHTVSLNWAHPCVMNSRSVHCLHRVQLSGLVALQLSAAANSRSQSQGVHGLHDTPWNIEQFRSTYVMAGQSNSHEAHT